MAKANWTITYYGAELQQVEGAGLFQHQTSATVSAKVAKRLWGQEDWHVVAPDGSEWPTPEADEPPKKKTKKTKKTKKAKKDEKATALPSASQRLKQQSAPMPAVVAFALAVALGFAVIVGLALLFLR